MQMQFPAISASWFLTEMPKIHSGVNTTSSTKTIGETKSLHIKKWNKVFVSSPEQSSTVNGAGTETEYLKLLEAKVEYKLQDVAEIMAV